MFTLNGINADDIEVYKNIGDLPLIVESNNKDLDLLALSEINNEEIKNNLKKYGAILFRNFSFDGKNQLEEFMENIGGEVLNYNERSSPRSNIKGKVYNSTEYPSDQEIFLHNENSYAHTWPKYICFYCNVEPEVGGETPIANCRKIYENIDDEIRSEFERKGVMYVRNLNPVMGLSWEDVYQTTNKGEIEQYLKKTGYEFEWKGNNTLKTMRKSNAVIKHPETGENIWFNHGTFFNVSTLPQEIQKFLLDNVGEENLPTNTYYGDGSKIESHVLNHLRNVYKQEEYTFKWRQGDLLLLDNIQVAHGRRPYEGEREIYVSMSEPIS